MPPRRPTTRVPPLLAIGLAGLMLAGAGACSTTRDQARPAPPTTTATGATTRPASTTAPATKPPERTPSLAAVRVKLTAVASFNEPVALAVHPPDQAVYVAERTGRVRALDGGGVALDLTAAITSSGQEQGLLGLAFAPDGTHVYVDYTDRAGDTNVVEYAFSGHEADPRSARRLLFVDQPYANHNGGNLVVGSDGLLWIGMGDGGSAGDPQNRAQDLGSLLGKLLRIDPRPSGSAAYTIPPGNPFAGRAGARGEIWAFGVRNPWRFSFDRANGDLWMGDVGQNAWEEIDWRAASSPGGENYGWPFLEGSHPFRGAPAPGVVGPVHELHHDGGVCSITGGYVYRGAKIPALSGAYLFADFCVGRVIALRLSEGKVAEKRDLGITRSNLSSFGQDGAGELFVLSLSGGVARIDPA